MFDSLIALQWHTNVESWVLKFLDKIIWHKLELVKNLYEQVLDVNFDYQNSYLLMAVGIRHDIVHRNGKSVSGKMLVLSKEDVTKILNNVSRTVSELQDQLVRI